MRTIPEFPCWQQRKAGMHTLSIWYTELGGEPYLIGYGSVPHAYEGATPLYYVRLSCVPWNGNPRVILAERSVTEEEAPAAIEEFKTRLPEYLMTSVL